MSVPSGLLQPSYSALEVLAVLFLAAIPMSRFSELIVAAIEKRTGIAIKAENGDSSGEN